MRLGDMAAILYIDICRNKYCVTGHKQVKPTQSILCWFQIAPFRADSGSLYGRYHL